MNETTPAQNTNRKYKWIAGCGGCALLLVVVGGIGAAIGIPAFINYTKRSKAVEARANVEALAASYEGACLDGLLEPGFAAGPLPAVPHPESQNVSFASDPNFARVGFNPGSIVRYSYSIRSLSPQSAEVRVEGDLDDDGVRSEYVMRCSACECGELSVVAELE